MKEIHLSEACWKLWVAVSWTIFLDAALLITVLGAVLMGIAWTIIALIIIALLVALLIILLYLRAYWRRFLFTYDSADLRVHSGIWWRKQTIIPIGRITNISIMQGPWQRARKLATLKIETAGQSGTTSPETQLWSQTDYEVLRDEILKQVSQARDTGVGDGTSEITGSAEGEEAPWSRMIKLLEEIERNTRPDNG